MAIRKQAAIYARSATEATATNPNNLDNQIMQCRHYCETHGYVVNERHIYQDVANGTDYHTRPGLNALRLAAREQHFDVVIPVSCDRLARDPLHIAVLLEDFEGAGVQVESVTEQNCYQTHEWVGSLFLRSQIQHERLELQKTVRSHITLTIPANSRNHTGSVPFPDQS